MTDKQTEALKLALEALKKSRDRIVEQGGSGWKLHAQQCVNAITAIRAALAEESSGTAQQQEPVTVLPDGSAFAVMSYPLPKDHWLYADRQYNDGEYEPVELGKPVLTHELRDAVVSAVRYAIRGATNCGKEVDFDPDALVQNAVYALCGPFTSPPASKPEPTEKLVSAAGLALEVLKKHRQMKGEYPVGMLGVRAVEEIEAAFREIDEASHGIKGDA